MDGDYQSSQRSKTISSLGGMYHINDIGKFRDFLAWVAEEGICQI